MNTIISKATVVINEEDNTLFVILPDVEDEIQYFETGYTICSEVYEFVKSYIVTAGVVKDSNYWENNIHDSIVTFLGNTSKYKRGTISHCLSALGY